MRKSPHAERTVFVEWLCAYFPHEYMEVEYARFGYAIVTVWAGGAPVTLRSPVTRAPEQMATRMARRIKALQEAAS